MRELQDGDNYRLIGRCSIRVKVEYGWRKIADFEIKLSENASPDSDFDRYDDEDFKNLIELCNSDDPRWSNMCRAIFTYDNRKLYECDENGL